MPKVGQDFLFKLYNEDCRETMRRLPVNSVDSIVTDPPYGYKFMGSCWDHGVPGEEFWRLALRIIKPSGYMLAFGGTRTFHRLAVAIEDAGWEIRDCIMWVYGTGFPKGKACLKPAWEPILLCRKPGKSVLHFDIDGCRIPAESLSTGSGKGVKGNAYGWSNTDRNGHDWSNNSGRYPANLIHDGSEEVTELFPISKDGIAVGRNLSTGKNQVYGTFNGEKGNEKLGYGGEGSAARFFYTAKSSKSDRGKDNNHPTVKPTALLQYLCRLITPKEGLVFDPFMGSGSTGKAAIIEGFRFVGCEIDKEHSYFPIAEARIKQARQS